MLINRLLNAIGDDRHDPSAAYRRHLRNKLRLHRNDRDLAFATAIGAESVELKRKCPGFNAYVHRESSIVADDESLDMIFHWSVFTHISPEDCFLYLEDSFRALKPGGKVVFSFLEMSDPDHYCRIFQNRVARLRNRKKLVLLDTFLHREWIAMWANEIGFANVGFTDGHDTSDHPAAWQTVAALEKPAPSAE
jgi:hypothetical protein